MNKTWFEKASEIRDSKDIKNAQIGRALGMSGQAASMKLAGKRPTSVGEIAIIAGELGVSVAELIVDDAGYVQNLDEQELLELFRLLTVEQRQSILTMMRSIVMGKST